MGYILPMMMMNITMMDKMVMLPDRVRVECGKVAIDYPLNGWYSKNWLIIAILCCILAPLTTSFNFVTLVTVYFKRRLRTIPNLLLSCLAIPDLLCGLLSQPLHGIILLQVRNGSVSCELFLTTVLLAYVLGSASFFTLFLISLERYLAVFCPYWYVERVHKKAALTATVSILWLISILLNSLSVLTRQFLLTVIVACSSFPIMLVFCCYVHIRIARLVRRIQRSILSQASTIDDRKEATSHATGVATLILLALLICHGPYVIVILWGYSASTLPDAFFIAHEYAQMLLLVNSFINPIIYCFRLQDFRREMILLPRFCCERKRDTDAIWNG